MRFSTPHFHKPAPLQPHHISNNHTRLYVTSSFQHQQKRIISLPSCLPSIDHNMTSSNLQSLSLSDSDEENTSELFASPSRVARNKHSKSQIQQDGIQLPTKSESKYDAEAAREAALKRELEGVRNINEVIEGVLSSLEVAKGNMDVHFFPRSSFPFQADTPTRPYHVQ